MTEAGPYLSVVFPAFNEGDSLRRYDREVLPVLRALHRTFEVVVVDDGSSDDTAAVAAALGPEVRVVRHDRNRGLAAALQSGFAAACGELLVTMDADLTFAPELVARLLERFERGDVDVVCGSPKLAGYGADIPSYRLLVSRAATWIYSSLLQQPLSAVSPIFRLYRRADVVALPLRSGGFEVNAEILFQLIRHGARAVEVPAPLTQRRQGESKLRYRRELVRHARLVLRMLRWRMSRAS